MKLFLAFAFVACFLVLGCSTKRDPRPGLQTRPSATKLDTLLQRVCDSQNVRLLPREDFASIVACFAAHEDFTEIGYSVLYAVLDKIADASKGDTYSLVSFVN